MRIYASVEVSNRCLPSLNMKKRRPEQSYLSIGFVSTMKDKVFILHQTNTNSVGTKYKVTLNIISLFEKFIKEGKLTIRFKDPPVDLIINGDPKNIKKFLQILKCSINENFSKKCLNFSNLMAAPKKVVSEQSTKLVIKNKKEIPAYPRSLVYLEITDCFLMKFDNRILRLQNLRVLNLKNNNLDDIPMQIELLICLEELILENNELGKKSTFAWLACDNLCSKLWHLDLRKNKIKFFPREVTRLKKLKCLFLDYNELGNLPSAIRNLRNLKELGISHNRISILPGSFVSFKLDMLDLSGNENSAHLDNVVWYPHFYFPTLMELAGKVVLQDRMEYSEKTLPRTLITFLEEDAGYCYCGKPSFGSPTHIFPLHSCMLRRICSEYRCSANSVVPLLINFNMCDKHAAK